MGEFRSIARKVASWGFQAEGKKKPKPLRGHTAYKLILKDI